MEEKRVIESTAKVEEKEEEEEEEEEGLFKADRRRRRRIGRLKFDVCFNPHKSRGSPRGSESS